MKQIPRISSSLISDESGQVASESSLAEKQKNFSMDPVAIQADGAKQAGPSPAVRDNIRGFHARLFTSFGLGLAAFFLLGFLVGSWGGAVAALVFIVFCGSIIAVDYAKN